jgi:hypothetical protein
LFLPAQGIAGAAWALFTAVAVRAAMAYGGNRGVGSSVGLVFSALALAALVRVGFVIAGLQAGAVLGWVPALAYLACGAVLLLFALGGAPAADGDRTARPR